MAGIGDCLDSLLKIVEKKVAVEGQGKVLGAVMLGVFVKEELERLSGKLKDGENGTAEVDAILEALEALEKGGG